MKKQEEVHYKIEATDEKILEKLKVEVDEYQEYLASKIDELKNILQKNNFLNNKYFLLLHMRIPNRKNDCYNICNYLSKELQKVIQSDKIDETTREIAYKYCIIDILQKILYSNKKNLNKKLEIFYAQLSKFTDILKYPRHGLDFRKSKGEKFVEKVSEILSHPSLRIETTLTVKKIP
jgi:hypothetical protein